MDFETIILKKEDHIATLTLNRPEKRNALNFRAMGELVTAIEDIANDETSRVLVITGAGRAFCSGGEYSTASGTPAALVTGEDATTAPEFYAFYRKVPSRICLGLQNLDIPTIAMVNGPAVGAGFDLALGCDIRVGSENARFSVAWTRMGLVAAFGGTWLLPRVVGIAKAAELIFTGRFVEAEEAERMGILNKLVPAQELERETMELAHQIAAGPSVCIRLSKMNLYKGLEVDLCTALQLLGTSQSIALKTEDAAEAAMAFREKREPLFRGK